MTISAARGSLIGLFVLTLLVSNLQPALALQKPTNGQIAYYSNGLIYRMNPDGSNSTKVVSGSEAAWSPDGSRIAFSAYSQGQLEIMTVDANGQNLQQITSDSSYDHEPTWSPDGKEIAYSSLHSSVYRIYTIDLATKEVSGITDSSASTADREPSWSPDGSTIAYSCTPDRAGAAIQTCTVGKDGTNEGYLTASDLSYANSQPSWSPGGSKLAFQSGRDGNFEIYKMDADGSNAKAVTDNGYSNTDPVWSPTGGQIAHTLKIGDSSDIYKVNSDGSGVQRLTTSGGFTLEPSWQALGGSRPLPTDTTF